MVRDGRLWSLPALAAAASFSAALLAAARPAGAQDVCDRYGCGTARDANNNVVCFTPARPAPNTLWGQLQPTDPDPLPPERDATDFNEFSQPYWSRRWYMGVDVQNGFVIAGLAHGVAVFDARTDPAHPALLGSRLYGPGLGFPFIPGGESSKIPFGGVACPEGNDNVAALAGYNGAGLLVFDLRIKQGPFPVYQDVGGSGDGVYAATIGGRNYAFYAANVGLIAYDLDAAVASSGCHEGGDVDAGTCPGVRLGQIPAAGTFASVHGVEHYLAAGGFNGVSVYDVSDPAAARLIVADATSTGGRPVAGIALWKDGASYYLAARLGTTLSVRTHDLAIYDATGCLTAGCTALGPAIYQHEYATVGSAEYLTFSRSGVTPFLFLGTEASCLGFDGQRHTWLLNVGDPRSPVDVTPPQTMDATADYQSVSTTLAVDYWSWYERGSPTGFNLVAPRGGKFMGEYFYRAGRSIMDVHQWKPPAEPMDAGVADAGNVGDGAAAGDGSVDAGDGGGRDVVVGYDTGPADFDSGTGGAHRGGCGCRAGGAAGGTGRAGVLALAALGLGLARRRRGRRGR